MAVVARCSEWLCGGGGESCRWQSSSSVVVVVACCGDRDCIVVVAHGNGHRRRQSWLRWWWSRVVVTVGLNFCVGVVSIKTNIKTKPKTYNFDAEHETHPCTFACSACTGRGAEERTISGG